MQGDDVGDNISKENRYYNEMTMIYWLYKNLDFDVAPKYIGVGHYRRFFKTHANYRQYDIILPHPGVMNESVYSQYVGSHDEKAMKYAMTIIKEIYPDYVDFMKEYLNGNMFFACNLMMIKKEWFFEYGDWIFSILAKLHQNVKYNTSVAIDQKRTVVWVAERLTGVFLYKKIKEGAKVDYRKVYSDPSKL